MNSSKQKTQSPQWVLDPDAIVGWYQGSGVDVNATPRPNQWGDFSEKPRVTSRMITVTGTAISRTPEELHDMRDQITSVFSGDRYGTLEVTNKSGTRYATVAVEGQIEWLQAIDTAASYKINFFAPDPRVYGSPQEVQIGDGSISGGVSYSIGYPIDFNLPPKATLQLLTNDGSVDSWPIFTVTGDFASGFTITDNNGHKVVYDGIVTMEAPVEIDMGRGTALQNGIDMSINVSVRQWFAIPAKKTIQPGFYPKQDGVGWCDILYRDTWI